MNNRNAQRCQHHIQSQVARAERMRPTQKPPEAMQAGARDDPAPPFPRLHQAKPGSESELDPAPMCDAQFYRGSGETQDGVAHISCLKQEQHDAEITKEGVAAEGRRCILVAGDVLRGIRFKVVAPGHVWTPLNLPGKEARDVSEFGSKAPMKRPVRPEEIAPASAFFASPQCSGYITGEILPMMGGHNG